MGVVDAGGFEEIAIGESVESKLGVLSDEFLPVFVGRYVAPEHGGSRIYVNLVDFDALVN